MPCFSGTRLSLSTMPQSIQGAARYKVIYRRNLVSPSCGACYKLTSPALSSIFLPTTNILQCAGKTCRYAAFAPRLCRISPAGKMQTSKSLHSCQQVFPRPDNFLTTRTRYQLASGACAPIYDTLSAIVTTCLVHSKQHANFQK